MKLSEQIAYCETCRNYARKVDLENWEDLFQQAWLKIKEHEIRDPDFKVKHYKTYFYTVLKSVKLDQLRKDSRSPIVEKDPPERIEERQQDVWDLEYQILNDWLKEESEDEYIAFLKQVVEASLKHRTKEEAAKAIGLAKRTFFKHFAEAKKEIDYEHFKITDSHPFTESDLVRLSALQGLVKGEIWS